MNFATLGLLFLVSLCLQDLRHHGALATGLTLLPLFAPLVVIAPPARSPAISAPACTAAALIAAALFTVAAVATVRFVRP